MTLDEYIDSVEDDIMMLNAEDTEEYGCCDMAEHDAYLAAAENVLLNLKLIKQNLDELLDD